MQPLFGRRIALRNACMHILFAKCILLLLLGQTQAQFRPPLPSANDPELFRPPVVSLQKNSQNGQNANPPTVQQSGQRVFTPNHNNTAAHVPVAEVNQSTRSAVQSANWTSETSETLATRSKSRAPLELRTSTKESASALDKPRSSWSATLSMFFSLAIVISFFLMVVWIVKKSQPHSFVKLPGDVVQVMGRTPMAPRQQMYVVRFGSKLLLISHQPGQTQTLGEITDADEVQRLAGLCEANQPGSISNSFREVLKQATLGKPDRDSRASDRLERR